MSHWQDLQILLQMAFGRARGDPKQVLGQCPLARLNLQYVAKSGIGLVETEDGVRLETQNIALVETQDITLAETQDIVLVETQDIPLVENC